MRLPLQRFVLMALVLPSAASGQAAVSPWSIDGTGTPITRDGVVGYEFELQRPITVVALGKFDGNANGLFDDVTLPRAGLWNSSTGELLLSAVVDGSSGLRDGAFYADVMPTELAPGSYVVGVESFRDQEAVRFGDRLASSSAVRWLTGKSGTAGDLTLPDLDIGLTSYFGPSFLVNEPLVMYEPRPRMVVQRDENDLGSVPVSGAVSDEVHGVEVRAVPMDGYRGEVTAWQAVDVGDGRFSGALSVPAGGWYQLEARALSDSGVLGVDTVERVGVGEVFVTAGQSNSANYGMPRLTPESDRVSAWRNDGNWQHAVDPQPGAGGTGGSPWPALGDLLVDALDVPVGFASVGFSGSRVDEWLPGVRGSLYGRLENVLRSLGPGGARAVIWHQGESDALAGTSAADYAERLRTVIGQSRLDAGFDVLWGVGLTSYLRSAGEEAQIEILTGQQEVISGDPLVFAGAFTNDLQGPDWRWDGVHFNEAGLREHANRWSRAIFAVLVPEPSCLALALLASLLLPTFVCHQAVMRCRRRAHSLHLGSAEK